MPFHVLARDEISDSFGMDSHSKEGVEMVKWRISHRSLRRPYSENMFKENQPSAHMMTIGKSTSAGKKVHCCGDLPLRGGLQ